MKTMRSILRRWPVLLVTAGALAATTGLTAANTVPDSRAGDGSGDIAGYAISDVDWTVDPDAPYLTDKVTFTLDADPGPAGEVKAKAAGTWHDCSHVGTSVTCDFADGAEPGVATMTALRVVVAE